jgi:hypothetical protein
MGAGSTTLKPLYSLNKEYPFAERGKRIAGKRKRIA